LKRSLILLLAVLITLISIIGCSSQPAIPSTASPPKTTAPVTAAPSSTAPAPVSPASSTPAVPATSAASTPVIEMRFSHNLPPQGWTTVQFLNPWAKKVEAATNGAIKIVMYPAQSLAAVNDNYDATVNNLAQLSWMATASYAGRFPLSEVITLPFITLPSGTVNGKGRSSSGQQPHNPGTL
jgi:TRAP-type C4-dicarboxylate transport system substrate-binding protein